MHKMRNYMTENKLITRQYQFI